MYAYCLYCQTQQCETIASVLQGREADRAFSPRILQRQRKEGRMLEIERALLPGYVFLYSATPLSDFWNIRRTNGVVRPLSYADGTYALLGPDYDFAMELYRREGRIGAMKVLKAGDTVRLADPLFEGYDGEVLEIDCRKQRAKIRFSFDHTQRTIWAACDVLFLPGEEICREE